MVEIREARRVARRAHAGARPGGIPADTASAAQAIQDALLRRSSPAEKLAQVARLSRMVHQLSMAGLRERHPTADKEVIRYRRAELQLGAELAQRVYGARSDIA
jgi:hypothetical protein